MTKNNHPVKALQPLPISFETGVPLAVNPHEDTDDPISTLHYHDCLEISYCVQGCGVFVLQDQLRSYNHDDLVVIPSNCTHRSKSAPNSHAVWKTLYIDLSRLVQIPKLFNFNFKEPALLFLRAADNEAILTALEAILSEFEERKENWLANAIGHLYVIFTHLYRLPGSQQLNSASRFGNLEQLAPALNHITENIADPISVTQLAGICHLSEPHFRRLFRNEFGIPPKQYVTRIRIELAQSMLTESRMQVAEIAYACGFDSLSSFNRSFNIISGKSPRQWRQAT